jgi:hypothetical protein
MDLQTASAAAHGLLGYVHLVAAELGVHPRHFSVRLERPPHAYLPLPGRLRVLPTRVAAVTWDDQRGWAIGVETSSAGGLVVLGYLGEDVLPAPEVVLDLVRQAFDEVLPGRQDPLVFPRTDSVDLPARLAGYARPDIPRRPSTPDPVVSPAISPARRRWREHHVPPVRRTERSRRTQET